MNLIYLVGHILLQIFKIILNNINKKHEIIADNPTVQIYVNKIKNRIVFNINTGYKLELLSPKTMRLLGSSKKDINEDKDGEIVPKLGAVEVHCFSTL